MPISLLPICCHCCCRVTGIWCAQPGTALKSPYPKARTPKRRSWRCGTTIPTTAFLRPCTSSVSGLGNAASFITTDDHRPFLPFTCLECRPMCAPVSSTTRAPLPILPPHCHRQASVMPPTHAHIASHGVRHAHTRFSWALGHVICMPSSLCFALPSSHPLVNPTHSLHTIPTSTPPVCSPVFWGLCAGTHRHVVVHAGG